MMDQSTPWTLYFFAQGRINSYGRKVFALSAWQKNFPALVKNNTGKRILYITNYHHVESANIMDKVMKFQWIVRALCLISFASLMFVSYLKKKTDTISTQRRGNNLKSTTTAVVDYTMEDRGRFNNGWTDVKNEKFLMYIREEWLVAPPAGLTNIHNTRGDASQVGQSMFVDKILKQKSNGFFVECGAGNGLDLSNSLFFELHRSWTGLLIEPNPELFLPLLGAKRKSYLTNSCLSTSNKSQRVIFAPLMSLGGILKKFDSSHWDWLRAQADFVKKKGNITVQCFTLHSLLLAIGQKEVDYFSLDVEGPELEILQTIPFNEVKIYVISVEYRVLGATRRDSKESSLRKLQNIRNFFKTLGSYNEVGILPWGSGINPRKQEANGLDVIFRRTG